ncbi:glycoside hydrolase superfamily [Zychaea mexicana]|uniref:glycoside hydrolase superfamily n=1 Tax=Zychaea mexicana TaxID=64656 RepID=UPI0022FE3B1B|nr:glycoside hydrolase superfamily [Zychaea mexicana]KAI9484827.1 glycoside hydrolase superfamily [Zychaea mexicana]
MQVNGPWFTEPETQRTVIFRGINLSGGTKLPVGVPSHEPNGFWFDYDRKVSFVGRPFPLDEADMHMQRLVDHGFTLLRFMVTWEAIEHEGPGIYDEDYLDYVIEILKKCKEYGLKVYLNPHQDTWSRHCGGSGHPGWTHTLAGLNPQRFTATNAAIVHNVHPEPEKFPKMIWNTNYQKLAAATLFTLFFAGKTYAPKCIVNGVHVQDYMQSHYIRAFTELARRVQVNDLQGHVVIGYDTMNEPGQGYIGWPDITGRPAEDVDFKKGLTPTPFEGMMLGTGIATEVDNWVFTWRGPKRDGRVLVDPQGVQAWLSTEELKTADQSFGWQRADDWKPGCIWANHGLWDPYARTVMRPDYFVTTESYAHYWLNFIKDYSDSLLEVHPDAILFVQPPIMEQAPSMPPSLKKMALTPHWYDGLTLVKKKWCSYNVDYINLKRGKYGTGPLRFVRALRLGEKAIRQCFVDQIETLKMEGLETLGSFPFIIGEIGIPYDMEPVKQKSTVTGWFSWMFVWLFGRFMKRSNRKSSNGGATNSSWSSRRSVMLKNKDNDTYYPMGSPEAPQNKAMDASIHAAECNLVSYTLWNYVPDNHPRWGDLWNGEDLSIWQGRDNAAAIAFKEDVTDDSDTSSETLLPETATDGKLSAMATSSSSSFVGANAGGVNVRDIISLHRPHAHKIGGVPLSVEYVSPTHKQRASFVFSYRSSAKVEGPTEIYVPMVHFPLPDSPMDPSQVQISGGRWKAQTHNENYWTLLWWCDDDEADQELQLLGQNIQ